VGRESLKRRAVVATKRDRQGAVTATCASLDLFGLSRLSGARWIRRWIGGYRLGYNWATVWGGGFEKEGVREGEGKEKGREGRGGGHLFLCWCRDRTTTTYSIRRLVRRQCVQMLRGHQAAACGRRAHGHRRPKPLQPVCLLRIFGRNQKLLRSRWGLTPCNQSIASGFGAAEIGRPAAPIRALAREKAALARRSAPDGFARRFGSVRAVKINGSRWRVP
jgi:hypothetical protein